MASITDLWTSPNPDKNLPGQPKRIKNKRWGHGKRYVVRWQENGKTVSQTFQGKEAADLHRSKVEVGQAEGTWITKDKREITMNDLWEPFIASKNGKSKKTKATYETAWKHIEPVFGDTPVFEIQRSTVAAWIPTLTTMKGVKEGEDPKPLGSSSLNKVGILFKAMLELAVELDVIAKNPMKATDIPRQEQAEIMVVTVLQADALIAAALSIHEIIELYLRVLLTAGPRPGEARGLKVKDLDSARSRIKIRRDVDALGRVDETKTGHHREIPIDETLLIDLEISSEGKDPEDWLLPDPSGHVWTDSRWRRVWPKILDLASVSEDFTAYGMRHTAASLAIAAGADPKSVQHMLGHASGYETFKTYSHLWEEGLDEIPGAIQEHMAMEREREKHRQSRRTKRAAERRHLRSVRDVG